MKKEHLYICVSMLIIGLILTVVFFRSSGPADKKTVPPPSQGIWVTVFTKEEVMYYKPAANRMIDFCKRHGIGEIYLQIYRGGEPYYDSQMLKKEEYAKMTASMGRDPVDFIVDQAHKNGIKVYAWINVLSLAQNKNAFLLKKYGNSVLTKDRNLRSSIRTQDVDDSDKFYLRDDQLFLEPGDERVVEFTLDLIQEIARRYQKFDGIHLDYIRYPYPVPFVPDSRFVENGITYGFGEASTARFEKVYGINPRKGDMFYQGLYLKWDAWKRDQVTGLVSRISSLIRAQAPAWRISAAVVPGFERAYSIAYQDWSWWLRKKLIDYVILMNYTRDNRLFEDAAQNALNAYGRDKIHLGIGTFLFKENKDYFSQEAKARELNPGGLVYFAYDDLIKVYEKTETNSK